MTNDEIRLAELNVLAHWFHNQATIDKVDLGMYILNRAHEIVTPTVADEEDEVLNQMIENGEI